MYFHIFEPVKLIVSIPMKTKNLISLTIAFCFIIMSISGLLMYFGQKEWHGIETLHILFGVTFLGFAFFHILNNWSSISGYSKSRKEGSWQKEFWVAAGIFVFFLIGGSLEIEPFMSMAHGGKRLFRPKREKVEQLAFEKIKTNQETVGRSLSLLIENTEHLNQPEMAIWVEDSAHHFVETLFLPSQSVIAEEGANEPIGKMIAEGEVEFVPFKTETLPAFDKISKNKTGNYPKFSPLSNMALSTKTKLAGAGFLKLEIKDGEKVEVYEGKINPKLDLISNLSLTKGSLIQKVIATF